MADKLVDIELFPYSKTAKRMLGRVSPIYDKSFIGKWLFEVMGLELDDVGMLVESLRKQCYLEQCTWAMRYWEERYGLPVDESKDLEVRRAAVIDKRGHRVSLTPATLEDILGSLTKRDVAVVENNGQYKFKIQIGEGEALVDYFAVIKKVNTVKPSHLSYLIELPRKGSIKLYFATAMYETKKIVFTDYDRRGVADTVWLVDENGNALADENMNILID